MGCRRDGAGMHTQARTWPHPCCLPQAFKAGDGWFDTGDLGWRAPAGVAGSAMAGTVVLTGRRSGGGAKGAQGRVAARGRVAPLACL